MFTAHSHQDLSLYISSAVLEHLNQFERDYLEELFNQFQGYPSLKQLWDLMDEQWTGMQCDPTNLDERVTKFYRHPIWLLNGLFIEQDKQSKDHRQAFANSIVAHQPVRIADFGGGFGGLARLVGAALPNSMVEIVEPHPHPAAIALAANTPNVRYVSELTGKYDFLIATDVFEHVPDPIHLAALTANHICDGGFYLIANCFMPVIHCHLPQLFHFQCSWEQAMKALGLVPYEKVEYGRVFQRSAAIIHESNARKIERQSKKVFSMLKYVPFARARIGQLIMHIIA